MTVYFRHAEEISCRHERADMMCSIENTTNPVGKGRPVKALAQYFKATVLGGALVVAPLLVGLVIIGAALRHTADLLRPVARLFPTEQFAGVLIVDLLAILVLVLLSFFAGLVIATRPGRVMSQRVDSMFLRHLPGFSLVRALTHSLTGSDAESRLPAALIQFDDCWVIGFVIERAPNSLVTVYVPSAPTPAVGSLYFMTADRVRPLDASMLTTVRSILRYGAGTGALLGTAHQLAPEPAANQDARPTEA